MKSILIIMITLFLQSCTEAQKEKNQASPSKPSNKASVKKNARVSEAFINFCQKFEHRNLPFDCKLDSKDFIDFGADKKKIQIVNSDELAFIKDDNESEYYYGYKITYEGLIGLICYQISDYVGYVLSLYDSSGELKTTLFLAGAKGLVDSEAEKEAIIGSDGVIQTMEIIPKDMSSTISTFKADYILKKYQITSSGKLKEIFSDKKNVNATMVSDPYRYILVE
jgi:hypothetical protein